MMFRILVGLLPLLALLRTVGATVETLSLEYDDRPVIFLQQFGFNVHGRFEINMTRLVLTQQGTTERTLSEDGAAFVLVRTDTNPEQNPTLAEGVCFHKSALGALNVADNPDDIRVLKLDKGMLDHARYQNTAQTGDVNVNKLDESIMNKLKPIILKINFDNGEVLALDMNEDDDKNLDIMREFNQNKQRMQPGLWSLYFSNCQPGISFSYDLEMTMYNCQADQLLADVNHLCVSKNYLSSGLSSLPTWFFLLTAVFTGLLVVWGVFCTKGRAYLRKIHHLMTLVVVVKVLCLFMEAMMFHVLKTEGHHNGWAYLYYIFAFFKGFLMFGVIVLVGTGWSYLRPFLQDRDKKVIMAVMCLQALVNIALVVTEEEAPGTKGFLSWRQLLVLMDMVCCCAILFPIVWSIKHLKQAQQAAAAKDRNKAETNLKRLTQFRKFYLAVVTYIYFTRIIVLLLATTVPHEYMWLGRVLPELASVAFYSFTGFLFRPRDTSYAYQKVDTAETDPEDQRIVGAIDEL